MKRVSMRKRSWLWFIFLLLLVALLVVLATRFNVAVLERYERAKIGIEPILGTIGFGVAALGLIILFIRLWHEMRLNQIQSEFLAAVTHELKTPLATLELASSLLRQTDVSKEDTDRLWRSHDSELKRLRDEVETLLEAARWDTKDIRLKREPVLLESWLVSKMDRWKKILGAEGELIRLGQPLEGRVLIDAKVFSLATDNIVDNARKFTIDKPRLTIETEVLPGKRWRIRFVDQGLGFESEESKKIFKRFYRSKHGADYSISGTGLGLHLAKEACKKMKIQIEATSPGLSRGATFTLEGKFTEGRTR